MPSSSGPIGPLALPIPAGATNAPIDDPAISGILDYLAFRLRDDLNAKLATIQGTSADACPVPNRFAWNPNTWFVRNSFPALYVWHDGKSEYVQRSLYYWMRKRTIHALYVFDELVAPGGLNARAGLISAVDASFLKAADAGRHPDYGWNGDPPGTALWVSLQLIGFRYSGGTPGWMAGIPAQGSGTGPNDGAISRGYPSLLGTFWILERVRDETVSAPADSQGTSATTIATNDDPATPADPSDVIDIIDGVLP
jgi:hypothetical protein